MGECKGSMQGKSNLLLFECRHLVSFEGNDILLGLLQGEIYCGINIRRIRLSMFEGLCVLFFCLLRLLLLLGYLR